MISELVLIIFTAALVFYTFNLGRIEVFDKRYKVYESLCELIRTINKYDDKFLDEIIDLLKARVGMMKPEYAFREPVEMFRLNFKNVYDQFIFHIESSRFLYNEEIYTFLNDIKKNSDVIKDYLKNVFYDMEKPEKNKKEYEAAIKYFLTDVTNEKVVDKFTGFLQYEENIFKYICNL
jgi:hypothetical protein